MTVTRLNPSAQITSGTPTKAQSDVSTGYCWYHKVGRLVVACANFQDPTPAGNAAVMSGFPKPSNRVLLSVASGDKAERMWLGTDGVLYWDTNYYTAWTNANFAYLAAE